MHYEDEFCDAEEEIIDFPNVHNDTILQKLLLPYTKFVSIIKILGLEEKFDFPEIVVVGGQSSGKTSVLETLIKRNCLPRGEGLVTRCPLRMQFLRTENEGPNGEGYAEFGHDRQVPKRKYNFSQVAQEIKNQTNLLAGDNKGIVEDPISLFVYSGDVIPLIIVDLPGLVKNAVGDQPEDIDSQVEELIMKYIKKPNTIILAISAAENNIANSEGLNAARKVDHLGLRTVGVVTKIDLAPNISQLGEVLSGKLVPLKHGFVGIRNFSDKDVANGKTANQVKREEEAFLRTNFPNLADQNGSDYLANLLSQLLMNGIKNELPEFQRVLSQLNEQCGNTMETLGYGGHTDKSKVVTRAILSFISKFKSEFEANSRGVNLESVCGKVRVNYVFSEVFEPKLATIDPNQGITEDLINLALINSPALEDVGITIEAAYRELVKTKIQNLEVHALDCIHRVYEEMLQTVKNCLDADINCKFPAVNECILAAAMKFIERDRDEAINSLKAYIKVQKSSIRSSAPQFRKNLKTLLQKIDITDDRKEKSAVRKFKNAANKLISKVPVFNTVKVAADLVGDLASNISASSSDSGNESMTNGAMAEETQNTQRTTEEENQKVHAAKSDTVKQLIRNYFTIIRRELISFLPKLVSCLIIFNAVDHLEEHLLDELFRNNKVEDLVRESDNAREMRADCQLKISQLREAEKTILELQNIVDL